MNSRRRAIYLVFLHLFFLLTKVYQYSLAVCLDYVWVRLRARKEERSTVLVTAIYSIKTKSWHLIEKLFLLKATFIFALREPNNLKALKDITKFSRSHISSFPPSGSTHAASTSQVYKIKRSNYSEPNYIRCRFSIVNLLNYAHFKDKIKIIWKLFKYRDLLTVFFNVIQVSKCIFLCQVLRYLPFLHFFPPWNV